MIPTLTPMTTEQIVLHHSMRLCDGWVSSCFSRVENGSGTLASQSMHIIDVPKSTCVHTRFAHLFACLHLAHVGSSSGPGHPTMHLTFASAQKEAMMTSARLGLHGSAASTCFHWRGASWMILPDASRLATVESVSVVDRIPGMGRKGRALESLKRRFRLAALSYIHSEIKPRL